MGLTNTGYCDRIADHYGHFWSAEGEHIEFKRGPISDLPSGFRILRYPPRPLRQMWTYCTVCMSQPADDHPIELHIFAPEINDSIAELLVATAHYHRTGQRLDIGHSVNFGRPWWDGSICDRGLISLPYLDGPKLEWLDLGYLRPRFLWLIPVTEAEMAFKNIAGLDALEQKFEKSLFEYWDPFRKSVA